MTRLALLATGALMAAVPALAASEAEANAQAIALCRSAIAEKAPDRMAQFERGDFKARAARLDFTVRGGDGERRLARCRVSNKDKKVTDLTIG